jgi:uncharacterized RDD family membrane protein YckC
MTPANRDSFEPAPLWRRLAAMLYDSLLVFAIWILVGFAVLSSFGLEQARTLEGEMVVMDALVKNTLFTAMLLSAFLFFSFFWTHSGQTLGMQAWRIRVLRNDGGSISWKQAAIRFASAPPSLLLLGLGYWYCLMDPARRSVPDLLSATHIVRAPA